MSPRKKDKIILETRNAYLKSTTDSATVTKRYNLTEEFSRTRRNHNLRIIFGIFVMMALSGGLASWLTFDLGRDADNIPVDVEAIDNLDLKAILDRAARTDADITFKENSLIILNEEKARELRHLQEKYNNEIDLLKKSDLEEEEFNIRNVAATTRFFEERESTINRFAEEAQKIRDEIEALKTTAMNELIAESDWTEAQKEVLDRLELEKNSIIADYEKNFRNMKSQFEQKEAQDALYYEELMKKLTRSHEEALAALELKYNPWADKKISSEIEKLLKSAEVQPSESEVSSTEIDGGNIFDRAGWNSSIRKEAEMLARQQAILNWLVSIPFINSVEPAAAAAAQSSGIISSSIEHKNRIILEQREEIRRQQDEIKARDKRIKELEKQLNAE